MWLPPQPPPSRGAFAEPQMQPEGFQSAPETGLKLTIHVPFAPVTVSPTLSA